MDSYFNLFQLKADFKIDSNLLEQNYRTLAARFHPDKFAAASAFEQKQAMMMSSTVNEAYRILKNPIDRAAYLLKLQNIDADSPEHTSFAPEFLMQQMEWRETLMEAQMEQNHQLITHLDNEIAAAQLALFKDLKQAFEGQEYDTAAQWVRHGRFLDKIRKEIAAIL